MNWTFQYWHPESRLGDPVRILFDTPDGPVERTFELAGICHYSSGFTDSEFILPESVLSEICPYDLTNTCEITVDAAQKETAYETLQSLADTDGRFVSDTYEDFVAQWESVTSFISLAVTVAAVQLILTFAVTKSFRRTSLIERVRYSE